VNKEKPAALEKKMLKKEFMEKARAKKLSEIHEPDSKNHLAKNYDADVVF